MGMFDYVNFECDCPNCCHKIDGFQTKDGPCVLANLEYWQVRNFYSHCDNCAVRIVYILEVGNPKVGIPIEAYTKSIRKPEHPKRV